MDSFRLLALFLAVLATSQASFLRNGQADVQEAHVAERELTYYYEPVYEPKKMMRRRKKMMKMKKTKKLKKNKKAKKCSTPDKPVDREPLDPLTIPKYVTPLVIPPVLYDDYGYPLDVEVSLRQFTQQVLPTTGCLEAQMMDPKIDCKGDAFQRTTQWGYGNPSDLSTFNNPSFTFEVTKDVETKVTWINDLVDQCGNFLPHIVQDKHGVPIVDQTLHWAAPNQDCRIGESRTDCRGATSNPYYGPVPMVTHVHGSHVGPGSDGYPEAWWLAFAKNIPLGFATNGRFFESDNGDDTANAIGKGYAIDRYPNDQPTTTLWYHDHTLGITRLNVYAASAGFWHIRTKNDGETGLLYGKLPGPPAKKGDDPNGDANVRKKIREISIAIQPKSFYTDGSLFYPADRAFFEGLSDGTKFKENADLNIPFLPSNNSDIAPAWNPEAFFETMVVNGNTWPVFDVAPERYRFRLLNAADSRFLNLFLRVEGTDVELPFYQIGAEQSLLPNVVRISTGFATPLPGNGMDVCLANETENCIHPEPHVNPDETDRALLMGPAERADVIVDFSVLNPGDEVIMYNSGPDSPYGGFPIAEEDLANPNTTGQVMKFVVGYGYGTDYSTPPKDLMLDSDPGGDPLLGDPDVIRDLALLEEESKKICAETVFDDDNVTVIEINQVPGSPEDDCPNGGEPFGPEAAVLGVNGTTGGDVQLWDDPVAQLPLLDTTEVWELWNWSADAHPIHLHLVKFQVLNRSSVFAPDDLNQTRPPDANELGWKDTVTALPDEITRVKAKFDIGGLYVWHCHVLSHEDNEMMVPYCVIDPSKPFNESCPDLLFVDRKLP